jgi:hypothetical protein
MSSSEIRQHESTICANLQSGETESRIQCPQESQDAKPSGSEVVIQPVDGVLSYSQPNYLAASTPALLPAASSTFHSQSTDVRYVQQDHGDPSQMVHSNVVPLPASALQAASAGPHGSSSMYSSSTGSLQTQQTPPNPQLYSSANNASTMPPDYLSSMQSQRIGSSVGSEGSNRRRNHYQTPLMKLSVRLVETYVNINKVTRLVM